MYLNVVNSAHELVLLHTSRRWSSYFFIAKKPAAPAHIPQDPSVMHRACRLCLMQGDSPPTSSWLNLASCGIWSCCMRLYACRRTAKSQYGGWALARAIESARACACLLILMVMLGVTALALQSCRCISRNHNTDQSAGHRAGRSQAHHDCSSVIKRSADLPAM